MVTCRCTVVTRECPTIVGDTEDDVVTTSRVVDTSSKDVTAGIFTASEAVVVASDSPVADQILGYLGDI